MRACADCLTDISLLCWRRRYCPDCAARRRRTRHAERQAARRALVPWTPRAVTDEDIARASRAESAAVVESLLADVAARRRRQRLTLTPEDCWRGAGSMAGVWEGAEL